jgi:ferrous iron transport protein A
LQIGIVQLNELPLNMRATVRTIDWTAMPDGEGHRLRSLGLDEGVGIVALHRGILFWKDPIAVRVGRMTIALRQKVAEVIMCEYTP